MRVRQPFLYLYIAACWIWIGLFIIQASTVRQQQREIKDLQEQLTDARGDLNACRGIYFQ